MKIKGGIRWREGLKGGRGEQRGKEEEERESFSFSCRESRFKGVCAVSLRTYGVKTEWGGPERKKGPARWSEHRQGRVMKAKQEQSTIMHMCLWKISHWNLLFWALNKATISKDKNLCDLSLRFSLKANSFIATVFKTVSRTKEVHGVSEEGKTTRTVHTILWIEKLWFMVR